MIEPCHDALHERSRKDCIFEKLGLLDVWAPHWGRLGRESSVYWRGVLMGLSRRRNGRGGFAVGWTLFARQLCFLQSQLDSHWEWNSIDATETKQTIRLFLFFCLSKLKNSIHKSVESWKAFLLVCSLSSGFPANRHAGVSLGSSIFPIHMLICILYLILKADGAHFNPSLELWSNSPSKQRFFVALTSWSACALSVHYSTLPTVSSQFKCICNYILMKSIRFLTSAFRSVVLIIFQLQPTKACLVFAS